MNALADDRPRRRRARRTTGLLVASGTLAVLAVALEVGARALLGPEIFSFAPVYEADDVAGYRLKPGLSKYALGAALETNSRGRRGPEWTPIGPAEGFRIALLGDSLAFGFGVEYADTVGAHLQRLVAQRSGHPCEVLNFAVPGYNTAQERAVLEREVLDWAPDLVLVLLTSNDADDALWVDAEGYLHWGAPGVPASKVESVQTPRESRWGPLRHSALLTWLKVLALRREADRGAPEASRPWMGPLGPGPVPPELRPAVLQPLVAMAEICAERQVPMALAAFAAPAGYRRLLVAFTEETGTPHLELFELFPEIRSWDQWLREFSLGWDSHPNPEAHRRWAAVIVDWLAENGLLPSG